MRVKGGQSLHPSSRLRISLTATVCLNGPIPVPMFSCDTIILNKTNGELLDTERWWLQVISRTLAMANYSCRIVIFVF